MVFLQGDAEGSKEGLGWRGLLEGVSRQVNDQLMQALEGSQRLLGQQPQVRGPVHCVLVVSTTLGVGGCLLFVSWRFLLPIDDSVE